MAASRAYQGADRGHRPSRTPVVQLTGGAAAALRATAAGQPLTGTTQLRCGGCQASAQYAQNKPGYGRLVRAFLGWHESCGDAVKITCLRGGQS